MHPLIHLEESNDGEDIKGYLPSKYPSSYPTQDPVHPSENFIKEPTSAQDPGTSQEPYNPTREDNKGQLSP